MAIVLHYRGSPPVALDCGTSHSNTWSTGYLALLNFLPWTSSVYKEWCLYLWLDVWSWCLRSPSAINWLWTESADIRVSAEHLPLRPPVWEVLRPMGRCSETWPSGGPTAWGSSDASPMLPQDSTSYDPIWKMCVSQQQQKGSNRINKVKTRNLIFTEDSMGIMMEKCMIDCWVIYIYTCI